jgi:hypothetical protein
MTLLSTYRRPFTRRALRSRLTRALIIIFIIWNLTELHLIQHQTNAPKANKPHHAPRTKERIYIASVNWNNEAILRSHWSRALLDLSSKLGPENIFISIYESGSYDNTKGALRELDWELERLRIPRNVTLSPVTHEDEIAAPARGEGWVKTIGGRKQLRRIPYLARVRNLGLLPLYDLARQGITFDKVLFLNDVVFTVSLVRVVLAVWMYAKYWLSCISQVMFLNFSILMVVNTERLAPWISPSRRVTMIRLRSAIARAMRPSRRLGLFSVLRNRDML